MRARLVAAANRELEQAIFYYESRRDGLGVEFADEFDRSVAAILARPLTWPAAGHDTRRYRMNRFNYGIIYAVHGDEVVILAVAHPSRAQEYWADRI